MAKHICLSVTSLKVIYCAFFNSVMKYGNIFWGNSSHRSIIFRIKKKRQSELWKDVGTFSCRNLFKKLQILPSTSQYMSSLLIFVVQNKNLYLTNTENHNLDIRQRDNLYLLKANLTIYQKAAYYSGITNSNNLPLEIKNVAGNPQKLKLL